MKMLQRHGDLIFTRCSSMQQVDHYLPLFFEQYVERRRGTVAAEVFARPEVRRFFAVLARSMLPDGWLHFSVLECAGQPVAFHFGFEFRRPTVLVQAQLRSDMARLSPGTVLLSYLIRDSLERGLKELDFTVGAEPFKYRYTITHRTNCESASFQSTLALPGVHDPDQGKSRVG